MFFKKDDFPIFKSHPSLLYFDNAATTHKPYSVIKAMSDYYAQDYASAYRGYYKLAEKSTDLLASARAYCGDFIGARADDIVFTRNATESINIVAQSWLAHVLSPGDEIVLTEFDHHANILPWQRVARERGAMVRWIRLNFDGTITARSIDDVITARTKFVSITSHSNVLGNINALSNQPDFLESIIAKAHAVGARILVDAAQSVPQQRICMKNLSCDFLVFSAHKMLGPTGVGILYVTPELHNQMKPYNLGGGMVTDVGYQESMWKEFPHNLEAGTIAVAEIIGFKAALSYLDQSNFDELSSYQMELMSSLIGQLTSLSQVTLLRPYKGSSREHLVSFMVEGIHPHDVAAYLDRQSVAVRAGNHCAQLLHKRLGLSSSIRASVYGYNTLAEIDAFINLLKESMLYFNHSKRS